MEGATDRARFAYLYTRAAVGNYTGVVTGKTANIERAGRLRAFPAALPSIGGRHFTYL